MLHIILFILKIIGIVLLCILGLILLMILCVLFVPVRYRIELERKEGEGEPPFTVHARITWLLHIVNVLIRYPSDKAYVRVRLFLFTLFRVPERQDGQSGHKKRPRGQRSDKEAQEEGQRPSEDSEKPESSPTQADDIPESPGEPKQAGGEDIRNAVQSSASQPMPEEAQEDTGAEQTLKKKDTPKPTSAKEERKNIPTVTIKAQKEEEAQTGRPEEKTSLKEKKASLKEKLHRIGEKIQNFFQKIKDLIENIEYTIRNICDKIKSVLDQIGYYREVIAGDAFQASFQLCKGELAGIVRSLKPQKLKADLTIGMDDPAATGEILAYFGMLYPVIGEYINITGDFEHKRIEGHALIKGRIRVFTFVRTAVRIYFNKDIRKLIKLLKKEAV